MRTAIAAAAIFLLVSSNIALAAYTAKTTSDVNLRAGKSTESPAIAIVRSGKQLAIIEDGETWVKVSTTEGKQGWINKKFLTKTKGTPETKAEEKNDSQTETVTPPPQKESASAVEAVISPEMEVRNLRAQLDDVTMQLEAIKKETSDCQQIKPEHEKALAEIENLNKTIDEMDKKIIAKGVRWFLAGAAVLLLGWFLGMNTRQKSRYY